MRTLVTAAVAVCFLCLALVVGCKPDPSLEPRRSIVFTVPENWPAPQYKFEGNPLTEEGFALGRKLFFDPRLSRDNSISCGSCHQPFSAFAQFDHDLSHDVDNKLGTRNSPPIFNMNWHTGFFWDGGVNHIELQPLNPIQNPVEMDEKLENIIAKLEQDAAYKEHFRKAFGDETINSQRIFKALAQFMGMLVSSNSRYDKYTRGETGGDMTASELNGLSVFRSRCASCHTEPLFSDYSYRNNGLLPSAVNDSGRGRITQAAEDMYRFKVPSLRNLKYTPPYMHDGRFKTLQQVLNHYTTGIHSSATLDPLLAGGLTLTETEKTDLLAFLNTLNDESFVTDQRFMEVK